MWASASYTGVRSTVLVGAMNPSLAPTIHSSPIDGEPTRRRSGVLIRRALRTESDRCRLPAYWYRHPRRPRRVCTGRRRAAPTGRARSLHARLS